MVTGPASTPAVSPAWPPDREELTMGVLDTKVAVVTGGSSGIGAEICRRFVQEGAAVIVADVDDARGRQVAEELGSRARFLHVDVTVEPDIVAAVATAVETWGKLDVMVNNAGRVGNWSFIEDVSVAEWDAAFALLCRSAFLGIKHASRAMRDGGYAGSIVNTGSIAGMSAGYGPHPYGAAKAALIGLQRSAAVELAPFGIRVNTLIPGGVATRIVGHGAGLEGDALDASIDALRRAMRRMQPVPRAGEPADLAAAAVFLASDDSSFITGQALAVDGGLLAGQAWGQANLAAATRMSTR
jgi:NAD(P)-dependent dehydrogenase (short-subunit alcohol dehydrogenase family)